MSWTFCKNHGIFDCLRNIWIKKIDKSCNLIKRFEDDLKNRDNLLNSTSLSENTNRYFNRISFSTLHELIKSNPFRVIIGHININSVRNKFEALKKWLKIICRHSFSFRNLVRWNIYSRPVFNWWLFNFLPPWQNFAWWRNSSVY